MFVAYPYDASNAWLVRTTLDGEENAERLARALVGPDLAACVHIHAIRSFYGWKGRMEDAHEWVVEARGVGWRRRRRVEKAMLSGHPYEVPMVEVQGSVVNVAYRRWMKRG